MAAHLVGRLGRVLLVHRLDVELERLAVRLDAQPQPVEGAQLEAQLLGARAAEAAALGGGAIFGRRESVVDLLRVDFERGPVPAAFAIAAIAPGRLLD